MLIFAASIEDEKINFQVILIVVLLGGGLIGAGGYIVKSQIDARVVAEISATAERTRADLADKQVERLEAALETDRERQVILQRELDQARTNETDSVAVLQDRQRLERLTSAKPGHLEILARKATTRVWKTIEAEANQ